MCGCGRRRPPTGLSCGRSVGVLTGRQGSLGLAVEHDVDAGEGRVSEQGGSQPGEQSPEALCLVHAPHSPGHAHVVVSATLEHNTNNGLVTNKKQDMI